MREEKPLRAESKLNPRMMPSLRIEPLSHLWEASTLSTALNSVAYEVVSSA